MRILKGLVLKSAISDDDIYRPKQSEAKNVGKLLKDTKITKKNYQHTYDLNIKEIGPVQLFKQGDKDGRGTHLYFVKDDLIIAWVHIHDNRVLGKPATEVKGILVHSSYQNKGLGYRIYCILFSLYGNVLGDWGQFTNDRKIWVRLSNEGDVSIVNIQTNKILEKNYKIEDIYDSVVWDSRPSVDAEMAVRCLLTNINTDTLILKTHKKGQRIGISK